VIASIAVIAGTMGYAGILLTNSGLFGVRDIVVRERNRQGALLPVEEAYAAPLRKRLMHLKGRMLFSIGLESAAQTLQQQYPAYRSIVLLRVPPDRVVAVFERRVPVASLKLYRQFLVSDDGVLLTALPGVAVDDVPLITGLETRIFGPKAGKRYTARELTLALYLIRDMGAVASPQGYRVASLDVANLDDITVKLVPRARAPSMALAAPEMLPFEVRISEERIAEKLKILGELVGQLRRNENEISYIDLRFGEPVIKLHEKKK
jgi:cell division septal protein FtsQ